MKKFLSAVLLLLVGFTLVGCNTLDPKLPPKEDEVVDKDEKPEDKEGDKEEDKEEEPVEVIGDKIVFDKEIEKNVWEDVLLNVEDFEYIIITIEDTSSFDLPLNIDNFIVDGGKVEYAGLSGTSYLNNHEFKIGELDAIGENVNTHQGNVRLHTTAKNVKVDHFIKVNVKDIKEFGFSYKVTTNAFAYLTAVVVEFVK